MSDESAGWGRGTVQCGDSAGFFSLSKTNNGHVTRWTCALLACVRTNQIEPRKRVGGLETRELERNNNLDFPSPHARAE
jgi:hypothetical protein